MKRTLQPLDFYRRSPRVARTRRRLTGMGWLVCLLAWVAMLPAAETPGTVPAATPAPVAPVNGDDPPEAAAPDLWNQFTLLRVYPGIAPTGDFALSADHSRLAVETANGIQLLNFPEGKKLATLQADCLIGFSPDGQVVWTYDRTLQCQEWQVEPLKLLTTLKLPAADAEITVKLLGTDRMLIVAPTAQTTGRKSLTLCHGQTGAVLWQTTDAGDYTVGPDRLFYVQWEKDGTWSLRAVALATGQSSVLLPDCHPALMQTPAGQVDASHLALDAASGILWWIDTDNHLRHYDLAASHEIGPPIDLGIGSLADLVPTPDAVAVAGYTASSRLIMLVYEPATNRIRWRRTGDHEIAHSGPETLLRPIPGGDWLLYEGYDVCEAHVLRAADGAERYSMGIPLENPVPMKAIQFVGSAEAVLVGYDGLEHWGFDPTAPTDPVDRQTLVMLTRFDWRHTLIESVIVDPLEVVATKLREHPEWLDERPANADGDLALPPIVWALAAGRYEVVKLLLDAGARVEYPPASRVPIFEIAVLLKDPDLMALLAAHGAKPHVLPGFFEATVVRDPAPVGSAWLLGLRRQEPARHTWTRRQWVDWYLSFQPHPPFREVHLVVGTLQKWSGDTPTAVYVYNRTAYLTSPWLLALQVLLLAFAVYGLSRARRRYRAMKKQALAEVAREQPDAAPPAAPVASAVPGARGASWGDDGVGHVGLTPQQAADLTIARGRLPLASRAALVGWAGGLSVVLVPALNWYWIDTEICYQMILPGSIFALWALYFIPWRRLQLLLSFVGVIGSIIGIIAAFVGAHELDSTLDPYFPWICRLAGLAAIPMIGYLAWNIVGLFRLHRLERLERAAKRPVRHKEEDLGASPSWDEHK